MQKTHSKKVRAVIYTRTSGDDNDLKSVAANLQGDAPTNNARSVSIPEQIRMCRDLCARNGYEIVGEFQDLDISGRTYPKGFSIPDKAFEKYFRAHIGRANKREREGLGRLLGTKNFSVVIVRDIFRLLRPAFHSHLDDHIWQLFDERGITIHAVEGGEIDLSRFEQSMMLSIQLQMANEAKRQEVEASRRSLKRKKDTGFLATGVKCLGFRSVKGKPQTVEPVESELRVVRLIFDMYRKGAKLLQIAKHLNDDLRIPTMKGGLWNVHNVSRVLLRPWYSGQSFDSSGALIPSQVFPSGDKAVIPKSVFDWVLASFEKRKRFEIQTESDVERVRRQEVAHKPLRGGSRIGIPKRGVVHPYTGLLKCGICGKHLRPLSGMNKSSEKIDLGPPIRTIYYICVTANNTKRQEYAGCSQVRIREEIPAKILELGRHPNGNGLIEALFPLLYHGQVLRYIRERHGAAHLVEIQERFHSELERLEKHQTELFDMKERGDIDPDSFKQGIKRAAQRRDELKTRIGHAEAELAKISTDGVSIPAEAFLDPSQMDRDVMRELAHDTFEKILVYPDRVTVHLKSRNPEKKIMPFDIPRVPNRNSRDLPFWRARVNTTTLTPDSKLGVAYFLKSTTIGLYKDMKILLDLPNYLEILRVGNNTSVDRGRYLKRVKKPMPEPTDFDRWLQKLLGDPPGYQRQLEVSSKVFFAPLKVPQDTTGE